MDFINKDLQAYCDQYTSSEPAILAEINRDTHANVLQPRMLSGHFQGRLLSMLSKMIQPQHILEIGTYTGYSAICLAEGLREKGKLITIDVNAELEERVRNGFEKAGMNHKIQFIIGDAAHIIPSLTESFDLVFIDADKENYSKYYSLVFDKLNAGGLIIADNVLWSGKVLDRNELEKDKDTKAIHEFNEMVSRDERVEKILLPVRDGLMIVRKVHK